MGFILKGAEFDSEEQMEGYFKDPSESQYIPNTEKNIIGLIK